MSDGLHRVTRGIWENRRDLPTGESEVLHPGTQEAAGAERAWTLGMRCDLLDGGRRHGVTRVRRDLVAEPHAGVLQSVFGVGGWAVRAQLVSQR